MTPNPNAVTDVKKQAEMKARCKMKVTLTKEKDLKVFRKLAEDFVTCPNCGHVQKTTEIDPTVWCLDKTFKFGYVEIPCPECGNMQVVLPDYSCWPECKQKFDNAKASAVDKDSLESHIGANTAETYRKMIQPKTKETENASKQKYRSIF